MSAIPDPAHALTATGNLRRRQAVSRVVVSLTVAAAALAVAVLLILVYYVIKQGIQAISLSSTPATCRHTPGSAAVSVPPWSARSSWC